MVQKTLVPRKVTREALNSLVDKAADIIRTATDYKSAQRIFNCTPRKGFR